VYNVLLSLLSVIVGAALGLLAEPLKARVLRRSELKLAGREIYQELAYYIAEIESVYSGSGHLKNRQEILSADFQLSKSICTSRPKFEAIGWYKSNRFDLLMRVDPDRGIRMLLDGIVAVHDEANSPEHARLALPGRILALLQTYEVRLDGKLLRKHISEAHKARGRLQA
jgi:hypothetical protein